MVTKDTNFKGGGPIDRAVEPADDSRSVPVLLIIHVETFSSGQYILEEGPQWKGAQRLPCMYRKTSGKK